MSEHSDPIQPHDPYAGEGDFITDVGDDGGQSISNRASKIFGSKRSMFIGIGVFAFVAVIVFLANTTTKPVANSNVAAPQDIPSTQADKPLTPGYAADLKQDDARRAAEAAASGTSFIATPTIGQQVAFPTPPPASDSGDLPPKVEFQSTPAPAPSQGQSSSAKLDTPPAQGQPILTAAPQPAYNQQVSQAMLQAMKALQAPLGGTARLVANDLTLPPANSAPISQVGATGETAQSANNSGITGYSPALSSQSDSGKQLVPAAGTILYARMIGELNSDAPGPALATIVAGPLAGARIIGEFQTQRAGLVIKFTTMTVPANDGSGTITTPINAEAVSADNLTSGMASSINNHLISNLAVTFVAGFAQGFGQAISQSGSTSTITGSGLASVSNPVLSLPQELAAAGGTAAGAAGGVFQQIYGNKPPTIKLEAGTAFALVFLGADQGVVDAQTGLQTVKPNSGTEATSQGQKFTPTLPVRSSYPTNNIAGYSQLGGIQSVPPYNQ